MTSVEGEDRMGAGSVFGILQGRWRMVAAAVVLGSLVGIGLNAVMPPVYRARVRIEIRRPPDASMRGPASFQSELVSMYTAAEMITSRSLLSRVADEYRARGWIRGGARASDRVAKVLRQLGDPDIGAGKPASGRTPATTPAQAANELGSEIDWLQSVVTVRPVRDTRLVDVWVEHTDSTAARVIAGRIGELFEDYARGTSGGAADAAASLASVAGAETPGKPASPVLDRPALQARLRMLNTNLADLTRARRQAQDDRLDAEMQLSHLRRGAGDTASDWGQFPDQAGTLGALRRDLRDCQGRLASARGTYGPRHPHLIELEQECAGIRANMQREVSRAIADQRALVASRASRERSLSDELARTEHALRAALAFDQSDAADADAQAVVSSVPAVAIVDGPMVGPRPVRPRKLLNIVVSSLTAGLLASAFALWKLGDPRTLRTPEEVEAELGLPVLGLIPRRPRLAMNRGMS